MLDVHPPHSATHTWRDFFIHIATIVVGLLIAVGLEQSIEAIHRHHQREQLLADMHQELLNNRPVIAHDLSFDQFVPMYDRFAAAASGAPSGDHLIHFTLPALPCVPGTFGSGGIRMILPSEAVWNTARESSMVPLLPAEQARVYDRRDALFQNFNRVRDALYENCPLLYAEQSRLAQRSADGASYTWTMNAEQGEHVARIAALQAALLKAFCFRLRYLAAFEDDLLDGGHRINGAPLNSTTHEFYDPEDLP